MRPSVRPETVLTRGPPTVEEDIWATIPSTLAKIPYYTLGAIGDALGYGMQTGRMIDAYFGNKVKSEEEIDAANPLRNFTSQALQDWYEEQAGTDYYEPQTWPGVGTNFLLSAAIPTPGGKTTAAAKVSKFAKKGPSKMGHNMGPPLDPIAPTPAELAQYPKGAFQPIYGPAAERTTGWRGSHPDTVLDQISSELRITTGHDEIPIHQYVRTTPAEPFEDFLIREYGMTPLNELSEQEAGKALAQMRRILIDYGEYDKAPPKIIRAEDLPSPATRAEALEGRTTETAREKVTANPPTPLVPGIHDPAAPAPHYRKATPEEIEGMKEKLAALPDWIRGGGRPAEQPTVLDLGEVNKRGVPAVRVPLPAPHTVGKGVVEELSGGVPDPSTPTGDVELGAYETTTPGRILNRTAEGGYSVHVPSGEVPTEGLYSGIYRNADPRNTVIAGRKATRMDVLNAFKKNKGVLQQGNKYFGGWKDPEGTTYLEPSQRFPETEVRKATKFAERTAQKKIFRLSDFTEMPVGDWEKYVKSDEFVDKLIRMGREGRTLTEAAAGKGVEWWDTPVLDEVYGPYATVARKFLATTSANSDPYQNVRKMSEYMRRFLKGEEIIQPDFRVPETATSFAPGSKMGIEESLTQNLERSAKGEPLSGVSVGAKDRVMNYPDPDPLHPRNYVPDRRWARVAEDPSQGVFTSGTEGVIRDEEQVTKIGEAIARAAEAEGRSVMNLSADVWYAMNPTEQAHPYNKLIEDAIAGKAPTMGMTVAEFKKQLGLGNAELLSILLGTPTLAGLANQFFGEQSAPGGS
jgi:hypothetical protein